KLEHQTAEVNRSRVGAGRSRHFDRDSHGAVRWTSSPRESKVVGNLARAVQLLVDVAEIEAVGVGHRRQQEHTCERDQAEHPILHGAWPSLFSTTRDKARGMPL